MSVNSSVITDTVITDSLARYRAGIRSAAALIAAERQAPQTIPFDLPLPSTEFTSFAAAAEVGLTEVGDRTYLLDLMRNPGTRTGKTLASLLMVARAVRHIRLTGERLLLLTPTSGNKGSALRDAVARAYATGFASPAELRIAVIAPEASRGKLRGGPLSDDPDLRVANPVGLAAVEQAADVKSLAGAAAEQHADRLLAETGFRLWYTLDLDNYRLADAMRAFVEADLMPITDGSAPRWHAHAVSSAYGLLGYHLGHRVLTGEPSFGPPRPACHPGLFLVQQLATPDMVLSLLGVERPEYRRDGTGKFWRQDDSPVFPAVTDDPAEILDATFYTKAPVTSAQINPLVARYGGGGVVVSRRECLERFGQIRELAAVAGVSITTDPAEIREWSLVKVLAGVLIARERRLIPAGTDVVVHASGYYTDALVPALPVGHTRPVSTADDVTELLFTAAR